MKYFCPFCQKKHPENNLAVSIDASNILLRQLAVRLTEEKKTEFVEYENYINTLIETAEKESDGAGFLCLHQSLHPEMECNGECQIEISVDDVIEALESALKTIARARKKKPDIIMEDMFNNINDFINNNLFAKDYEEISYPFYLNITNTIDKNDNRVLHEARANDGGLFPKVCWLCHQPVFKYSGEYDEIVIGLLGSERVAKSSCIASTIYAFLSGEDLNDVSFEVPQGDKRWQKSMNYPVFLRYSLGFSVGKTQTKLPGSSFCVTVKVVLPKKQFAEGRDEIILTFIDMPGEYMNDPTGMAPDWYSDHKGLFEEENVDAFWFCFDEAQLYQISSEDHLKYLGYGLNELGAMDDYLEHIVSPLNLRENFTTIKTELGVAQFPPTALILTKSESFTQTRQSVPSFIFKQGKYCDHETRVYDQKTHCLKLKDFVEQSAQIKKALSSSDVTLPNSTTPNKNAMITVLSELFVSKAFFSTSAYAEKPLQVSEELRAELLSIINSDEEDRKKVRKINALLTSKGGQAPTPYNPRLPLYWTLAALGKLEVFVRSKKTPLRTVFKKSQPALYEDNRVLVYDDGTQLNDDEGQSFVVYNKLCMHGQ